MVRSILIITVSSLLFSLSMASDSYRSPQGIQVGSCPAPGKGNKVGTLISHNFRSGELSTRTGNPKKNGALDPAVQISKAFCPDGQVYGVGDVNGDNFIDHICIRKSDVVVLLGNLKQIAKSGQAKFCSGEQDALFVADMDGNGADDLVCHSEDSSLSIIFSTGKTNRPFLGQEVVTLKNTKICTGRTHGGDLALHLEDITGNKRAELVCQTQHKSLIEMWKSTGTGSTFKLQKINPKGQKFCHDAELTFLDAEGNGRKEYLICKDFDDRGSFKAGAMWFFKFDPKTNVWKHIADWHHNTGFVSGKKYPSKNFCGLGHMKAADFNGDKRDDLVCVGEHQTKIILSPKPKTGVEAWFYFLSYGPNGAGCLTYDDKFGTGECEELFVH